MFDMVLKKPLKWTSIILENKSNQGLQKNSTNECFSFIEAYSRKSETHIYDIINSLHELPKVFFDQLWFSTYVEFLL